MAKEKPGIPGGMRDFSPVEVMRRRRIQHTIETKFERFGFELMETCAMEKTENVSGKYGEEGDRLMYRILNSGDYLAVLQTEPLLLATNDEPEVLFKDAKRLSTYIAEKALRYDLTVPFARYVVMRRNDILFPFKRYQIQTVWRADRPQKGRYREFMQCDADVIGSTALIYEAEFIQIYDDVFTALGFKHFAIKLNHRKILAGIVELIGATDKFQSVCTAIDKLDKIGPSGVEAELTARGLSQEAIEALRPFLQIHGDVEDVLAHLSELFAQNATGTTGIEELRKVLSYLSLTPLQCASLQIDLTLARGLDYYTGTIFEVKIIGADVGSVGGGGRYDELTAMFHIKNISGVGISFGLDRIYDAMLQFDFFSEEDERPITQVLFANFGTQYMALTFSLARQLRTAGVACDIYPEPSTRLNKQLTYANNRKIPLVAFIGENEVKDNVCVVKNMETGEQMALTHEAVTGYVQQALLLNAD